MKNNASLPAVLLLSLASLAQASELGWQARTPDPLPFRAPVPAPGGALSLEAPEGLVPMRLDAGLQLAPAARLPSAQGAQRWAWPKQLKSSAARRLLGWTPANPEGSRLLYLVKDAQGHESRMTEGELAAGRRAAPRNLLTQSIEEIRAQELAALITAKGATAGRDVSADGARPMAEFTYADGHKEVVPYDPLVFDLKGTGVKTDERVTLFDLYGYGRADKLQWMNDVSDGTGILVFDADHDGRSGRTGAEVFGDRTDLDASGGADGYADGFAALRALALKAAEEGVLGRDAVERGLLEAGDLAALERAYGLKMKLGGFNARVVTLAEAGVASISLSQAPTLRASDFDGRSNDLLVQPGAVFTRADGSAGSYMNLWLKAQSGGAGLAKR